MFLNPHCGQSFVNASLSLFAQNSIQRDEVHLPGYHNKQDPDPNIKEEYRFQDGRSRWYSRLVATMHYHKFLKLR